MHAGQRAIVGKLYHSMAVCWACWACCGRAAGRNSYSRSEILAGPDGPVLATRERALQEEPSSIYDGAEGNCMM